MRARLRGPILALALSACFPTGFGIEIVEPPPPPPEPPVPDRFVGETAPELVPSQLPGFKKAPSLDPRRPRLQATGAVRPCGLGGDGSLSLTESSR